MGATTPSRIRVLVRTKGLDQGTWQDWACARDASVSAARIALQRVERSEDSVAVNVVGLGFGETLRWFGPINDAQSRRLVIAYAEAVLDAGDFPSARDCGLAELPPEPMAGGAAESASTAPASLTGIMLLTHADTDLLSLERARAELPTDFPDVVGHSLRTLSGAQALMRLFGERRVAPLCVIVRIHSTVSSVPGLGDLLELAHREAWGLVVISGVGGVAELLPRTSNLTAELASNLTSYFMSGGVANLTQALRYVAATHLGFACDFVAPRPMPAHGLYHPDLLLTDADEWEAYRAAGRPNAIVLFYRAHVLSGNLLFIDALLRAAESRGFAAIGVFTSSLRDCDATGMPLALGLLPEAPAIVFNTVSFPLLVARSAGMTRSPQESPFERLGIPFLQAICCGSSRESWSRSSRGLPPSEAAMNVALPECDGRIIAVPVSFKDQHRYVPDFERTERLMDLGARFAALRSKSNGEKRIAIVLSNAGGKAQRIGGAVGLDTPTSLLRWLIDMRAAGYDVGELPPSATALMSQLLACGSYDEKHPLNPQAAWRMPRTQYARWFEQRAPGFRDALSGMWGRPGATGPTLAPPFWRANKPAGRRAPLLALQEPHSDATDYWFAGLQFGKIFLAIQPPRGHGVDPEAVYHAPDLPPCHHHAAFYCWLAQGWCADAVIQFGTHGTLEWLPGKSLALSAECAPDVLLADLPLFYPFVVNNPGEGAQAKRRAHAVIVDHLIPPPTHADSYGPLAALSRLVEEYYRAEVLDTNKLPLLRRQVWELVRSARLEDDLKQIRLQRHGDHEHPWDERLNEEGVPRALEGLSGRGFAHLLEDLDAYLCDLGQAQIRGGLHVFGAPPEGTALVDLLFAILRSPNGNVPSLTESLTRACHIDPAQLREARGAWLHPLAPVLARRVPQGAAAATVGQLRGAIDDLARDLLRAWSAEGFATRCIEGVIAECFATRADAAGGAALHELVRIGQFVGDTLAPNLARTTDETHHLLAGLSGGFVPAGPGGSPSRGMAHVLPTGRNFYTVDPRGLPTPAAWATGAALAREAATRHKAAKGRWPESIALSIWGSPTMRTGGDDIGEALALLGVRPIWDPESRRTCGLEVIALDELGRPRIDVTLRVSGFFRDAFANLMHLFDEAVQRVAGLDEPPEQNFIRKHWLAESGALQSQGCDEATARRRASYRVFSSKPGVYGTGLMQVLDAGAWHDPADLAQAVLLWGGWAYSPHSCDGIEATEAFRRRLARVELVLHNQDSPEQDLFDSSEYFEFHGGLITAVSQLSGRAPQAYVGDASDPSRPLVRTLQGEALRVYRSRIVNPKWLGGIQRYGYRGGLEMAATVDALFGYSATAGIVTDWMYEGIAQHFTDGAAQRFLQESNPWALSGIVERLLEAEQRGLWSAKTATLERLQGLLLASESALEELTEGYA
jgi:cobaltochelatase CobN